MQEQHIPTTTPNATEIAESSSEVSRHPTPVPLEHRSEVEILDDIARALENHFPDAFFAREHRLLVREHERVRLVSVPELSPFLSRAVDLRRRTKKSSRLVAVPRAMKEALVHGAHAWFRPLRDVVYTPYLTEAGSVVTQPGYRDGIWLHWSGAPVDPGAVTWNDINDLLERMLDFPFLLDADRVHAFGLMLLPLLRPLIAGPTPLHLIVAEREGVGKTYLAQLAGVIALGEVPPARALSEWPAEAARQLEAYLQGGSPFMLLDNLPTGGTVGGHTLHGLLTSQTASFRPVGSGAESTVRNECVWVATANSADVDRELARRCVPIRLKSEAERSFRTPGLTTWVLANRAHVLACLLHMIQEWLEAERPAPSRSLPSFDEWSKVVGGVIQYHGGDAHWLEPSHRPRPKLELELEALVAAWPRDSCGAWRRQKSSELVGMVRTLDLVQLLRRIHAKNERGMATKLGNVLQEAIAANRAYDGLRLVRHQGRDGAEYAPELAGGEEP